MFAECPQCAQKLRPGWRRCPRCRMQIPQPPSATEGDAPAEARPRSLWPLVAGVVVACGIGFSVLIRTSSEAVSPAEANRSVVPLPARQRSEVRPIDPEVVAAYRIVDSKRAGTAAYKQGDFAAALSEFQAAVAAAPGDSDAQNNLAQVLIRQGRAKDALPHLDEAVRLDSQRWSYRFNRARAYGLLNRWEEAATEYRKASELFPDDHATLYNLGLALLRVKQYPAAVTALEQAVTMAPEEHGFLITLGTAYVGAEQPAHARATFEQFLKTAPSDPDAPRVKALLEAMTAAGQ